MMNSSLVGTMVMLCTALLWPLARKGLTKQAHLLHRELQSIRSTWSHQLFWIFGTYISFTSVCTIGGKWIPYGIGWFTYLETMSRPPCWTQKKMVDILEMWQITYHFQGTSRFYLSNLRPSHQVRVNPDGSCYSGEWKVGELWWWWPGPVWGDHLNAIFIIVEFHVCTIHDGIIPFHDTYYWKKLCT